jgi:AcrR family transcriptional regulator
MLETSRSADPRVARTIGLLEQALLELLEHEKLHRITVQRIAQHAGVNRATFYAHFYDKYALYRHVVRTTFLAAVRNEIGEAAVLTRATVPRLVVAVLDYFAYLNAACPPSDRELRPMAEIEIQRVLMKMFEALISAGTDASVAETTPKTTPDTTPDTTREQHGPRFAAWGLFGIGMDTVVTETPDSRAALVQELTARVLGALDADARSYAATIASA